MRMEDVGLAREWPRRWRRRISSAARTALVESLARSAPDSLQIRDGAWRWRVAKKERRCCCRSGGIGKVSRVLLDRSIKERLAAAEPAGYAVRIEKLTKRDVGQRTSKNC